MTISLRHHAHCNFRFIRYIYEELFQSVKRLIEDDLHFYSILIDGATDSSVTENELIYLRFVENGKPVNHYFSIEEYYRKLRNHLTETDYQTGKIN